MYVFALFILQQHFDHVLLVAVVVQPHRSAPLHEGGHTLQIGPLVRPKDAIGVFPKGPVSHTDV
jgi:hypothetical protein